MNFSAMHLPCWLIPAIVGVISGILGYLLGKLLGGGNHDDFNNKIGKLQTELDSCKLSKVSLKGDLKSTKASLALSLGTSSATLTPFDPAEAKAVFGKKIKENDLTIVEGIGPKIQELFHNHDIKTWKTLSECTVDKCLTVLSSGGNRFKIYNPGTWPEQAKMGYEGNWKQLLKWQDELVGGK